MSPWKVKSIPLIRRELGRMAGGGEQEAVVRGSLWGGDILSRGKGVSYKKS